MNKKLINIDVFVEDRAQEEFIVPLVKRISSESGKRIQVHVRCARGGHGHVLEELKLYQKRVEMKIGDLKLPDLLVVGKDANCKRFLAARRSVKEALTIFFRERTVIACPDPHIERWYLADAVAFNEVVGTTPRLGRRKCARDRYKAILAQSIIQAGLVPTLGGIEFAQELVTGMDPYRAGKADASLKAFIEDFRAKLKAP
jgi:hypothetical protein